MGVSNTGVEVPVMADANQQGMIYYINHFKNIVRTCTHADADLYKVPTMYHQRYIEEAHKDSKVVATAIPRDCPKTFKTVENCIRGFRGVYGKTLRYGLRDDLIDLVAASDSTYHANGSEYFTQNEEMIARGLILSGPAVLGTEPEEIGTFSDSLINDIVLICDNMFAILQGLEAWTYLKPAKNNRDGILGLSLIYNHYFGPSNIDNMAAGADNNIAQCSYTKENRNWNFDKYATLHKEQHNIL